MSEKNYITFIDSTGRSILGTVASETEKTVTVANPVMVTVQQQQGGQMAVQLFPLFFAEFVAPDENGGRDNYFEYNKCGIQKGVDFKIEPRIIDQYDKITNPQLVPVESSGDVAAGGEPETIKLFDDE